MERLKELYGKYVNWIVVILLVLFGLKCCGGCSNKRQYKYQQTITQQKVDSLESVLSKSTFKVDSLMQENKHKEEIIIRLSDSNKDLRKDKESLYKSNRNLSESNKNLSKKENNE